MSEIQDEAYTEAMDEIGRWKVQHEEMLLKHAREQHAALSTLDEGMKEIERLSCTVAEWRQLLIRAAEALEFWMKDLASTEQQYVDAAMRGEQLLAELRKAAG